MLIVDAELLKKELKGLPHSCCLDVIDLIDELAVPYNEAVKFISYDGRWPNLCSGTLVVEIMGKQYSLKGCMESGGYCCCGEPLESGPWTISIEALPEEIKSFRTAIEIAVNDNVEYGCCGGCL